MRTVIILTVMAIILFGLAAGGSIFLTSYLQEKDKAQHPDAAANQDTSKDKELPPLNCAAPTTAHAHDRALRRRPSNWCRNWPSSRQRQDSVARQEQALTARRRSLELIKDDIRSEREEIDKVAKELADQVKGADEELASAERRVKDLEQKKKEEEDLLKDAKRGVYEAESVRSGNLKRVSGIADTAEPAEVAAIFERMIDSGAEALTDGRPDPGEHEGPPRCPGAPGHAGQGDGGRPGREDGRSEAGSSPRMRPEPTRRPAAASIDRREVVTAERPAPVHRAHRARRRPATQRYNRNNPQVLPRLQPMILSA